MRGQWSNDLRRATNEYAPPPRARACKVENLVKAATNGSEYTESSLKFEPMDARKRWLMFEFVGSNNGTIKLCNLSGPYSARGIEVGPRTVSYVVIVLHPRLFPVPIECFCLAVNLGSCL